MASGDLLFDFGPQSNEPPGSAFSVPDEVNNGLVLDMALNDIVILTGTMPNHYAAGGVTITHMYGMTSATANDIKIRTNFERRNDGFVYSADSFETANKDTGDITVPGAIRTLDYITSVHTNAQLDGLLKNELFRLKVTRIAVVGTDASGDLELLRVMGRET